LKITENWTTARLQSASHRWQWRILSAEIGRDIGNADDGRRESRQIELSL